MSNTIQQSAEYISATAQLQSLLYPTKVSKISNKPTTLADRIEAIPSETDMLVARNSRDGLEKFLNQELNHLVTVRKIENQVVKNMAAYLVASETDIREKRVIATTHLSKQIITINTIMEQAKRYLNNTAFQCEKMNSKRYIFSNWLPDHSYSYFETAMTNFLAAQEKPTTTVAPVVSNPAQKKEKTVTNTPSSEVDVKTVTSPESLPEKHELTPTQSPHESPRPSIDLEKKPQIAGVQELAQEVTLPPDAAVSTLPAEPILMVTAAPSVSEESIKPETPQAATVKPTQQPDKLQLPKVASSTQIAVQSVDTTKVANSTATKVRIRSQEPPPPPPKELLTTSEATTSLEIQDQKKNLSGAEQRSIEESQRKGKKRLRERFACFYFSIGT